MDRCTKQIIDNWISVRKTVIGKLYSLANELDEMEKKVRKAKITGAASSIGFTICSVVAGIAAIPTGGATLPAAIGFGGLAAAGGATTAISAIVKAILNNKKLKEAQVAIDEDLAETKKLKKYIEDIKISQYSEASSIHNKRQESELHARATMTTLVPLEVVRGATLVGGQVFTKSVATIGRLSFPVARVAGPIVGILVLPFDLHTLVKTAIDIDKKRPSDIAEDIRKRALHLQNELDEIVKSME